MCLAMTKNKKMGITIASVIFGVVGLLHLIRLIANVSVVVAGNEVPVYFSGVALVGAWFMAFWMWCSRE
jgi:hypothetical protein